MKSMKKILSFLLILLLAAGVMPACRAEVEKISDSVRLTGSSETVKQEVTVKTFIDGDTTHFHVPQSVVDTGVLKARYLAVNTPETTGKIEEYGKKASQFTREKLTGAYSILIESDNASWNRDSTGDRYLVWVWYKTDENSEYRNLNIELLENGLAIANSSANNRYGDKCMAAIDQAKKLKLNIYSGAPDPDFYYGDAIELTLKELRSNLEFYNGKKVAFKGVITINHSNAVYVEEYDAETEMYFGMSVYYGYGLSGKGLEILKVGNEARIVGTVQFYEAGGTWQVSGLTYRMMKPKDPGNIQLLSEGHAPSYTLIDSETFLRGKVTVRGEEADSVFEFAPMAVGTSVEMKNLFVESVYTTLDEESSSYGAMTLLLKAGEDTIQVRTQVLYENGERITGEKYLGKTIDVKGIVDYYEGVHQIKVFLPEQITIY
ncbi:MAG: thermonuclease family protein [Clostridia bacterium]|nr:thermonuclease family protein [Clostridia bacterium]